MNILWFLLGGGPFFGCWWVVVNIFWLVVTVQKMKFCIKDFFCISDQFRRKLRIWS